MGSDTPSNVVYSIGIQTVQTPTFHKATQTQTICNDDNDGNNTNQDTVSDLVGIYKDIDDLFNVLSNHLNGDEGQKHLESLRDKVKKLTHMKITERKMSKTESANSIKIARDRIQQIRQRRATLKQKHSNKGTKVQTIDEND